MKSAHIWIILVRIFPHSEQNNSEYGHLLLSVNVDVSLIFAEFIKDQFVFCKNRSGDRANKNSYHH